MAGIQTAGAARMVDVTPRRTHRARMPNDVRAIQGRLRRHRHGDGDHVHLGRSKPSRRDVLVTPRPLSPRQRIIATLVAAGLSDKQIAGRLGMATETVGYHVGRIAAAWKLDSQLNFRVQITHRVIQGVPNAA